MTLVFEDGKWVVAHKIILAASSLLLGKNKHPHPLIFMRGIQSNKDQWMWMLVFAKPSIIDYA